MQSMNILFVREYPLVDGTFTLFVRLATKMKRDGHRPYFLFFTKNMDENLLKKIKEIAPVFYYEELKVLKKQGALPEIKAIHAIVSGESLYSTYDEIKTIFFPEASVVIGIYHPRAFITKTLLGPSADTIMCKFFFGKIPNQNLVFMNNTVKKEHEYFFKQNFSTSPVVPLLVDIPAAFPDRSTVKKNKIVSIGRLVSFKNYISPVIELVTKLNSKGYSFEYHIYGNGSLYNEIESLIRQLQAEKFVYLHGNLNYTEFNNVLKDALLFIGMGTSIIEASAQGVPSLLAIESFHHDATYGWFFNQDGYEIGEQIKGKKNSSYEPFILEAFNADPEQYHLLCEKSWQASKRFSEDEVMPEYYNFISNADSAFSFMVPRWKKFLLKLLRQPLKLSFFIKEKYKDK